MTRQKSISVGRQPKPSFLATHLCRFFLKELHFSILKKREEARDDVFQEGGVLRRRCHILKLTSQRHVKSVKYIVTQYILLACFCAIFFFAAESSFHCMKTQTILFLGSVTTKKIPRESHFWGHYKTS